MKANYYRRNFHTAEDLAIFSQASEVVQRAGLMCHADPDMDVVRQCTYSAQKDRRRGDWMHNFEMATHGLPGDDVEEIFQARQHHREVEFG